MKDLKYELGFSFDTSKEVSIRDGLVLQGTEAFIEEVSDSEVNECGNPTPYRVFFYECWKNGEILKDSEGHNVGSTHWFTQEQIEAII